jgi:hypothetical protein
MALRLSTGLRNRLLGIDRQLILDSGLDIGDFDLAADVTSWGAAQTGDGTLTHGAGAGANSTTGFAYITGGAALTKYTYAITVKANHIYKLSFYYKSDGVGNGKVYIGTTDGGNEIYDSGALGVSTSYAQTIAWFDAGANTTLYVVLERTTAGADVCTWDEVQVEAEGASLKDIFKDCFMNIYAGSQPATADDDASSYTLLATIYSDGSAAGLEFGEAASGAIAKKTTETWSGTALASGTAGWFRIYAAGDGLGSSTVDARIDGAIATSGAEVTMGSTAITSGAVQSVSAFSVTIAASQ